MALPAFRGIFPLLLLLLLTVVSCYAESTTNAPTRSRRNQQRLQQLQQAQDSNVNGNGIDIGPGHSYSSSHHHHHLRHEQHLRAELAGNGNGNLNGGNRQPPPPSPPSAARQAELEQLAMLPGPGQQHHLRHHNRHHAAWEQRVFPALRHQQHRMSPAMISSTSTPTPSTTAASFVSTTDTPVMRAGSNVSSASSRYFDRDGIYPSWMQPRSTRAPNWQQLPESDESDDEDDDDDDENYEDDADDIAAAELAKQMPRYSLFSQKMPEISSNQEDYDAYDQSDVESVSSSSGGSSNNGNRHPSVASGHSKAAAKRNIFDWLFKRDKEKVQPVHVVQQPKEQQQHQQLRLQPQPVKAQAKPRVATEKPNSLSDDGFPDEQQDNDNSFEGFSNERWNKIQHEHHLKQQKHQKELQALRESNRNVPLIRGAVGRGAIDNEVGWHCAYYSFNLLLLL